MFKSEAQRYRITGAGHPTIVLLNGAGARMGYWSRVAPLVSQLTATFACDRQVPSDFKPGGTRLGAEAIAALRHLLAAAAQPPPYILVAHSMGGLYANLHARLHAEEVCGVVLVDSTHPEQERRFAPGSFSTRALRKAVALWDRLFGPGVMTEVVHLESIADEIRQAPAFPDIPLTVITAGIPPPRWQVPAHLWDIHLANQRELALLSPQGRQIVAKSDHYIPRRQPAVIAQAVADMLAALKRT